jgi:putative ABC transport system permease protein
VLCCLALMLLSVAALLYSEAPTEALLASAALALATVLLVPVVFAAVLATAHTLSEHAPRLSTLAIALGGVRGTTLRSLALAATGAVALFGSVALGGARSNLLNGIRGFSHSYAADAPIWVGEAGDNQATEQLAANGVVAKIARLRGVASVAKFQGAFMTFGPRRVWVLARGAGAAHDVLATQTIGGSRAAGYADQQLARGGWVTVSRQIASEHHASVGARISLPTPTGPATFRIAAFTSNLAWSPGAVIMNSGDFTRDWESEAASALAVTPAANVNARALAVRIRAVLGAGSGLEVATAQTREAAINALTSEGLSQLGMISTMLILAAILALAAALTSSLYQRRHALAALRLAGATPARLRRILLVEGGLMLGAGCVAGAVAGVFGQFVIDQYLREVTGFPVSDASASARPVAIFLVVLAAALAVVAVPGWAASRVPPAFALAEE